MVSYNEVLLRLTNTADKFDRDAQKVSIDILKLAVGLHAVSNSDNGLIGAPVDSKSSLISLIETGPSYGTNKFTPRFERKHDTDPTGKQIIIDLVPQDIRTFLIKYDFEKRRGWKEPKNMARNMGNDMSSDSYEDGEGGNAFNSFSKIYEKLISLIAVLYVLN